MPSCGRRSRSATTSAYRVVAEGVETQEALDLVTAAGCDEAQGYFFGQPLSAKDFAVWFRAWSPASRPRLIA